MRHIFDWLRTPFWLHFARGFTSGTGLVVNFIRPVVGFIIAVLVASVGAAETRAADDFPLAGSYTQNVPCKGDGSDPTEIQVKISSEQINSHVGVCTFLDTRREGTSINAHVECRFPAGPLMGDITFTIRSDKTVEFIDRDRTYSAVLYRCPK